MSNPLTSEEDSELFGSDGLVANWPQRRKGAGAIPADLQGAPGPGQSPESQPAARPSGSRLCYDDRNV
jgi:hypothetical protein